MTATPLTMTDPRWADPRTVEAIAAGPDWQERIAAAAHDLAHPRPVAGCPGCPQVGSCQWCGLPLPVCDNPTGHDRRWRGCEASLLTEPALSPEAGVTR
jgi:hypothetical protein